MSENIDSIVSGPVRGDSSTGDLSNAQVGTPKVGGVSPIDAPRKFALFPTFLFILLSIVVIIYLLFRVRTLTIEKTTSSPSPTPIAIVDPTVDWQKYTSQSLGFSFKYPPTYVVEEKGSKDYINLVTNKNEPQKDQIGIDALSITSNITYDKVVNSEKTKLTNIQEIDHDNWLKILGDGTGYSEGEKFSVAIVKYRENAIKISTISRDPIVLRNFDQILSTFKFATTSYSCPTTEWVDCEPGPDVGVKLECTTEYLSWAQTNCPGFKGAAL